MDVNYKEIGKKIRQYRKELNMTQAQLGELAGVEPSNISHIERGATKLSLPTLIKIANALGRTVDELIYDSLKLRRIFLISELDELLLDCSDVQVKSIIKVMRALKEAILENDSTKKRP